MTSATSNFILGAVVGILAAVLYIYWKQITFLQQNAGAIGDVSNIVTSGQNLFQTLKL